MAFDLIARGIAKSANDSVAPMIWRRRPSLVSGALQGTATQNAARLQAQINALLAEGGGTLNIVEDEVTIDQPLIVPAKVSIIGPGRNRCVIRNTRAAYNFNQSAIFLPGNLHPISSQAVYGDANSKALNAVTKGDLGATLTTASDAAGFVVGDVALFLSNNFYLDGSGNRVGAYMAVRRITRIGGAVLYVDEPFFDSFSGIVYNLRTGTLLGPPSVVGGTGLPLFVWGDGEIGGFSIETPGYWMSNSAVYKGRFFDIEARARALCYGNTFQHTRFAGVGGRFAITAVETSLNSENVMIEGMVATYDATQAADLTTSTGRSVGYTVACSFQENCIGVRMRDCTIDVTGTSSGPVMRVINAEDISIRDVTAQHRGATYSGDVIAIGDTSAEANRRVNRNNSVTMSWSGPCGTFVNLSGATTGGTVIDGTYRGTPASVAVLLNGPTVRNSIARTAMFEQGRLRFGAGTINQDVVGCYIGGGVEALSSTDYSALASNHVAGIRTSNSAIRRAGTTALATTHTVGTTEADVLGVALGTATLQRQDLIEFAARLNVSGTLGTKTLNVKIVNTTDGLTNTLVQYVIPAATTGIIEVAGRINLTSPAMLVPEATCSNSAVTITRTALTSDLSAKTVELKMMAVRANAADSTTIAMARLALTNPVQV